jgi:hypothetical protein
MPTALKSRGHYSQPRNRHYAIGAPRARTISGGPGGREVALGNGIDGGVEAISSSGQRLAISVHVGSGLDDARRGHGNADADDRRAAALPAKG